MILEPGSQFIEMDQIHTFYRNLDEFLIRVMRLRDVIKRDGYCKPILLTYQNEIADGLARYFACRLLGWTHIPFMRIDKDGHVEGRIEINPIKEATGSIESGYRQIN